MVLVNDCRSDVSPVNISDSDLILILVSNVFSKSNMNVSTRPPLSKVLAQSFITVAN